ncbi:Uncharacterised protein [Anaerobiospirillum thomasii]|nr:Uncharacterised protein [Anaerobiospirillum thomasii]
MNLIFNHGNDRYMAEIEELYINTKKNGKYQTV